MVKPISQKTNFPKLVSYEISFSKLVTITMQQAFRFFIFVLARHSSIAISLFGAKKYGKAVFEKYMATIDNEIESFFDFSR